MTNGTDNLEGMFSIDIDSFMLRKKVPSIAIPLYPVYPPLFYSLQHPGECWCGADIPILISIGTVLSVPGNAGTV